MQIANAICVKQLMQTRFSQFLFASRLLYTFEIQTEKVFKNSKTI